MSKLRKIFTISVMLMTVLSMSVVVAPTASAAASAGDLIKMDGLSSVYYLAGDGKRYVFPNETTYNSWYSDFSGVVTISQSELESYPLGSNVTVRPGTKLVKITTNPKVYAVESDGSLVWVPDESTASTLYGANWAKRVVDVPDAFWNNYNETSGQVSATAYPEGSLVKFGTSADVYYINADGTARKVATEAAFSANRFKWADVITATIDKPVSGADITGMESVLVDTSSGAGGVAGAGTGLTVALSSATPASATIIANSTATTGNAQALVPFLKLNFTASSDGAVKVTNLKIKRTGISADANLDALYLYEGDDLTSALVDGASVSSNYVTFNNASGLFTVPAGTTKVVTLRGDVVYNIGAGKTVGFTLESASDVTTNGAAVSGSFPAAGNLMSTANTSDLGRLSFTGYTTTPSAANTSLDAGQNNYEVWKFTLQSNEQELALDRIKITAVGSIQSGDLKNFKLVNSGSVIAEVADMNSNYEIDFDLSANPFVITKGSSKVMSLRADIVSGSTREFYMSIQNKQDVIVRDTSYGVLVQPYSINTWSIIMPTSTYDWSIAAGSLSVSKSTDCPNEDVVVDGLNVLLAKYDFRASGEDIKVKNLLVGAYTSGNNGVDNVKVYKDGVQVGSTADIAAGASATTTFTFGSTFIVKAGGTSKVEIFGDAKKADSTSYSNTNTIQIELYTGSSNGQKMSSLGTTAVPAAATIANSLTITSSSLTMTEYSGFADATVVAGTNNARLGSFILAAGASEAVSVSSITVTLDSSPNEVGSVSNMYLKDHATGVQLGDTVVTPSTSNIISVNFTLPVSGTKVIDLYANIISGSNPGNWTANIDADGSGLDTGNAVSATAADIQTMTVGSGALYPANGSQPSSELLLAGTTGNSIAQFSFTAANEGFTIREMKFKTESNFASSVAQITLTYQNEAGTTKTASLPLTASAANSNATATFVGLDFYVPKESSRNIDVSIDTVLQSSSGQTTGNNGKIYLDFDEGFKATGDSGTDVTSLTGQTDDLSNSSMYIVKSKPTVSKVAITGSPSSNSPLFKFKVVSDALGEIELKQVGFTFVTSGASIESVKLYDSASGTALTDTAVTMASTYSIETIIGRGGSTTGYDNARLSGDDDVQRIGTSGKTFDIRGTVTGWGDSGDSITVQLWQDTTATTTAAADTVINGDNHFVWSDLSITGAAHTTATADWTNGYLIKDMNITQDW